MSRYSIVISADPAILEVTIGVPAFVAPNPAPAITSLTPPGIVQGSAAISLAIVGTGFVAGKSVVKSGASALYSGVVDATHMAAALSAARLATPGPLSITVTTPAPGGGTSAPKIFNVVALNPNVTSLAASVGLVLSANEQVVITGVGFATGFSVPKVNGTALATYTVDSYTQITATLPSTLKTTVGTLVFTVANGQVGGDTGTSQPYFVQYAVPTIAGAPTPASVTPGTGDTIIAIPGTGFFPAVTLAYLGATALATTVTSPTTATATILAALLLSAQTYALTMRNPTPGGGTSNSVAFSVLNPTPVITSLGTATRAYFAGTQTIAINGTGFVAGTTLWVNAGAGPVQIPCVFNSSTSLTAMPPSSIHWPAATFSNTRLITAVSPSPGGGTSTAATYTLTIPTYVKCWYHPSTLIVASTKCTGWTDISGNNYHLTATGTQQATYVASATNGRPSARVDGIDDVFQSPTIATVSQPWNLFLDVAILTQGASKYLFSTNSAAKVYLNALPTPIGFAGGTGGSPSGVLPYTGDFTSMNFALAGGNGAMICNGRTTLPAPAAAGAQDTFTQFYIGGQNAAGANGVNAEFQEVMLTSGTIPAGDLAEINYYRETFYRGYAGANAQKINGVLYGDSRTFGTGQAYSPVQVMTMLCGPDAGVWINRGVSGITAQSQNTDFANVGANYSLTPVLSTTLVNFVIHDIGINDTNIGRTDAQILADVVSCATKFYAWCVTNQTATLAAQARYIIKVFDAGDRGSGNTGASTAQKEAWRVAFKNSIVADTTTTSAGGVTRPLFAAKVLPLAALDDVTLCGTTSLSLYAGPTSAGDLIHLNTWGNLQSWRNGVPAVKALIALVP